MVSVSASDDPLAALLLVHTEHDMNVYLHQQWRVPFATHVSSIEHLFNELITALNAYEDDTDGDEEELASHFILCKRLLARYVTLRSAGKMHRRFISPAFQDILKTLRGLTATDVIAAAVRHSQSAGHTFTDLERDLINSILDLSESTKDEFPNLSAAITLYLMVTFQYSLDVVTDTEVLPKQKVSFSYCDALQQGAEGSSKTELHDWRGVVKSIFPAQSSDTFTSPSTPGEGEAEMVGSGANGELDAFFFFLRNH